MISCVDCFEVLVVVCVWLFPMAATAVSFRYGSSIIQLVCVSLGLQAKGREDSALYRPGTPNAKFRGMDLNWLVHPLTIEQPDRRVLAGYQPPPDKESKHKRRKHRHKHDSHHTHRKKTHHLRSHQQSSKPTSPQRSYNQRERERDGSGSGDVPKFQPNANSLPTIAGGVYQHRRKCNHQRSYCPVHDLVLDWLFIALCPR